MAMNKLETRDDDGISIGVDLNAGRIVEKAFVLSSKSAEWPEGADGKKVELEFRVLIDMAGVSYASVLDDAIRTKIVRLQNALRPAFPFETLREMSKHPLRRTYDTVGHTSDAPEKAFVKMKQSAETLTPKQAAELMELLKERAKG